MKKIIGYLSGIIIIFFLTIIVINYYVIISTKNKIIDNNIPNVDCILVLGAGLRNNNPSPMLKDRLDKSIELYDKKISNKLLMSGDHTKKNYDEVNIMKEYAIDKGVPSKDIFMDHAGISTYDSIYRAKNIFNAKRIIIVTQKYHLYRALYIADKLGIEAYGVEAEHIIYSGNTYRELREVLARDKDFIKTIYKPKSKYLGSSYSLGGNGDVTND
ncbi:MAG: YdcF family protein [Bacilli bacterium]|nr:YdcF family protein [Bacilli bacterium]